jgi:hypothetical protein
LNAVRLFFCVEDKLMKNIKEKHNWLMH